MGLSHPVRIRPGERSDAQEIVGMLEMLLCEIVSRTGESAFAFNPAVARQQLELFLDQGRYITFMAESEETSIGFISLTESCALYAEGVIGIIPELFVAPGFRSSGVGAGLLRAAREYGRSQQWNRLEVTTPALPEFEPTLALYQREGFIISGGRKLRHVL